MIDCTIIKKKNATFAHKILVLWINLPSYQFKILGP